MSKGAGRKSEHAKGGWNATRAMSFGQSLSICEPVERRVTHNDAGLGTKHNACHAG